MSIKRNFLYSSFLTVANYIFPLLTFPYVSRVLGVEAIGKYNFTDNIIQIFIIVSMLGIETIGVREIAQNKTDQDKLNNFKSNLRYVDRSQNALNSTRSIRSNTGIQGVTKRPTYYECNYLDHGINHRHITRTLDEAKKFMDKINNQRQLELESLETIEQLGIEPDKSVINPKN